MQNQGIKGDPLYFKKLTLYNRNRNYFKNNKTINHNTFQIQRRTPQYIQSKSQSKFNHAFTNSTIALSTRVTKEIHRFKSRLTKSRQFQSPDRFQPFDKMSRTTSRTISYQNKPKNIKGINMSVGLKRKPFIQISTDPPDQRLFHNYKQKSPDQVHTFDFGKKTSRDQIFIDPNLNDLDYKLGKKFQKFYYNTTIFKSLLDYKSTKSEEGRVWMNIKRQQDLPSNDLEVSKILEGFEALTIFKRTELDPFYNGCGRELPSQLQMRIMKVNENHWKDRSGQHYVRPELEFTQKQQLNLLKQKRLKGIKQKKKAKLKRGQVCGEYFYRRYK